jgi:hypothetical protein
MRNATAVQHRTRNTTTVMVMLWPRSSITAASIIPSVQKSTLQTTKIRDPARKSGYVSYESIGSEQKQQQQPKRMDEEERKDVITSDDGHRTGGPASTISNLHPPLERRSSKNPRRRGHETSSSQPLSRARLAPRPLARRSLAWWCYYRTRSTCYPAQPDRG